MTRLNFRGDVAAPRPASAWAMVSVASATLWITEQLALWVVAAQAACLVLTLANRTRVHPLQQSAVVLNLAMLAIVFVTIRVALRGEPSTIALAHFAALTQCLQLVDARPRRTEFLLVALALFQVVLAANLTDSVLFPPLVCAFLFATVWTLLVHTLRSEAIEAGRVHELPRAFTPGLLHTTLISCALSLAVAALLFVSLPRLRGSVVMGPSLGAPFASAGFSDTVALGDLGRIRQDPRVVLRVETLAGRAPEAEEAYWRGLAFDRFDGTTWSVTRPERHGVSGSAEGGVRFGKDDEGPELVQRIVREPVASSVLFAAGDVRELHGTVRRLERDRHGSFFAAGQDEERLRYVVRSRAERPSERALLRDRSVPPQRDGGRSLALPQLSERFLAAARALGADPRASDFARVRAIERALRTQGRYTDDPPDPVPGSPLSPVEAFLLGDLAGHCEYFASAMVLVARSQGIPARLVNGFAGGRTNAIGDFVELTHSDAHAWVEVHFERAGWVAFDPTPPDLRLRSEAPLSLAGRMAELGSALELWWFQRVVGFDRSDQIGALKTAWLAWRSAEDAQKRRTELGLPRFDPSIPWREVAMLAGSALAVAALVRALRQQRRATRDLPPADYRRALRMLARRGLLRGAATPARDFATLVRSRVPAAAADAFDALTESYLAERFGARPPVDGGATLRALAAGLRRAA
jgi:transglutaminase-like putative cysteine protease